MPLIDCLLFSERQYRERNSRNAGAHDTAADGHTAGTTHDGPERDEAAASQDGRQGHGQG